MSVDIIIFLPLETITTLAWREGFEPSIPISRYTPLAGERIQPSSATSTQVADFLVSQSCACSQLMSLTTTEGARAQYICIYLGFLGLPTESRTPIKRLEVSCTIHYTIGRYDMRKSCRWNVCLLLRDLSNAYQMVRVLGLEPRTP